MKVVLQKVKSARVLVDSRLINEINKGLVILLAIRKDDTEQEAKTLAEKCLNLKVFEDNSKMRLSARDIKADILVIPEFTLYGDTKKGAKPNYNYAANAEKAKFLYDKFIEYLKQSNLNIKSGVFRTKMLVEIFNDGPVTLILEE